MMTIPSRTKPPLTAGPNGVHPLAARLAGCWLLNEAAGRLAYDRGGQHYDGGFSGGPLWLPGAFGPAVDFDGNNDWISMGNCLNLGTDDLTMLALLQYSAADQPDQWQGQHIGAVAGQGYLGSCSGYGLFVAYGNKLCWQVRYQSTAFEVTSDAALNDGQWHVVAAVCDRDQTTGMRLYVDGVRQSATADPTSLAALNLTNSVAFAIGSRQDSDLTWAWDFLGRVAAVYVWKRVLTETEIGQLYREPFALFTRRRRGAAFAIPVGATLDLAGSASGISSASASLQVIRGLSGVAAAHATAVGTLRRTNPARVQDRRPWLREALFNGMTSTAFKLGTMLTQGWFWTRRSGCTAVYQGESVTEMDLGRIVHVVDPQSREVSLPAYLSPPAGSTRCYLVRCLNGCGNQERTTAAAVAVRVTSDGELTPPAPNGVFGLRSEQIGGGRLRLTWFYHPLDQQTEPQEFHLYWDNGTGVIDPEHPLGTIPYKGSSFYQYETGPLENGRYTFVLCPCSADHGESASRGRVTCAITSLTPDAATILGAQAV